MSDALVVDVEPTPISCGMCGRDHPRCRAHRGGNPCASERLPALDVCMYHSGMAGKSVKAQKRRAAYALRCREVGSDERWPDTSPAEALLAMVREASANVEWLRAVVDQLTLDAEHAAYPLPEGQEEERDDAPPPSTAGTDERDWTGGALAGRTDPAKWEVEPSVWWRMYSEERDRLVRYAKVAHDAGVEARLVAVAEEQGRWLTRTLDAVLDALHLTPQQQGLLPLLMPRVIDALEAGTVVDVAGIEVEGQEAQAPPPPS